ncbi:MAG TPA: ATP-binding protein [Azospirillaceae bacterium]|nr:ATP-binding protein [Azospirillaceae bacterium]
MRWATWMEAVGPGRILSFTVAISVCVSLALVHGHFQQRMDTAKAVIRQELEERALELEHKLAASAAFTEALRGRARFHLAEHAEGGAPQGALLDAFLASNPGDETGRLFTLDRVPPPYSEAMVGNLMALPTAAARRREGLQRPDPSAWRQEAAMALTFNPLFSIILRELNGATRAYYASASGMLNLFPWAPSNATDLLETYPRRSAYRMALPAQNPARGVYWTDVQPMPGGQGTVTVAAPLDVKERFAGLVAIELSLAAFVDHVARPPYPGGTLVLVNEQDQLLAHPTVAPVAADGTLRRLADVLPEGVAVPGLKGLGPEPAEVGGHFAAVRPLARAPWRMVFLVPSSALTVPMLKETALSLAGLSATLLFVLLLSNAMIGRILRQRAQAVQAERASRAEAEQALADLRAAHDELDFLNREKTRFFSLVSHDLRGPFNVLLGMTEELANHGSRMRAADVADFAKTVHESARTVHELLENLLHWSRVQMSGTPFAPAVIALHEVVSGAVRDVTPAAEAKRVSILDAVGDRHILADRTMILAVLRNLLMNAIKFSHPGGVIHVTSRALGDRLELAVTDHGVGMDRERVQQLFRPSTGSQPGTRGETGTGLGLTLVRDLVLRHGGELKVDSEPGKGTTVSFSVPLAAAPPGAERRRAPAAVD